MKSPYDIIKRPLVTEKTTKGQEKYQTYTFEVDIKANKSQIKQAIETIFPVKVKKIRTIIMKGKPRRFRFRISHQSDWKKAMVTLKEGYRIDVI